MVQSLWKIISQFLKSLNIQLSAVPLLGVYPKELKTGIQILAHKCSEMFTLITLAKRLETTQISTSI